MSRYWHASRAKKNLWGWGRKFIVVVKIRAVNRLSKLLKDFNYNTRNFRRKKTLHHSLGYGIWVNLRLLLSYFFQFFNWEYSNEKCNIFPFSFINILWAGPIPSFNPILNWTLFKELRKNLSICKHHVISISLQNYEYYSPEDMDSARIYIYMFYQNYMVHSRCVKTECDKKCTKRLLFNFMSLTSLIKMTQTDLISSDCDSSSFSTWHKFPMCF